METLDVLGEWVIYLLHSLLAKIKLDLNQYGGVGFMRFQLDFLLLLMKIASPTKQIPVLKIINDKAPNTK